MSDGLAKISGGAGPEEREMRRESYVRLEKVFWESTGEGVPKIDTALAPIARLFHNAATQLINDLAENSECSEIDHDIISEHVFRRLGDLQSAMDNVRAIARDLSYVDLHMICERMKNRS